MKKDDNSGMPDRDFYEGLNNSLLSQMLLFKQYREFALFKGKNPLPEYRITPERMYLQHLVNPDRILADCDSTLELIAALPKEIKPFYQIAQILVLYFRTVRECLEKLESLPQDSLAGIGNFFEDKGLEDKNYAQFVDLLRDCDNMADEIAALWHKHQELMAQAAFMTRSHKAVLKDMPAGNENGPAAASSGALGKFISESRIKQQPDITSVVKGWFGKE